MKSLPKILKKLLFSFLAFIVLFASLVTPVKAEWYNPDYKEFRDKVGSGSPTAIFGERYTQAQVWWIIWSLFTVILEAPLPTEAKACLDSTLAVDKVYNCMKATSIFAYSPPDNSNQSMAAAIFEERPISVVTFLKDAGRNIHVIPEAKAQTTGFGFTALNPILALWKGSRNIVYSLMVLIIIALAFMIMFKVKLNPQTAITVQSAIPKVVIALILITFSYAIAGLLIDLMYVVIGIISLAMSNSSVWGGFLQPKTSTEFFDLMTQGPSVFGARLGIFGFMFRYWVGFIIDTIVLFFSANNLFINLGALIGVLIAVLSIIVLLWNGIRIIWMLFKALAQVLLLTIVAPFQILLGVVIPGMGFGAWLRSYVSNLAVFPTVGVLFVLASLFLTISINSAFNGLWDLGLIGVGINFLSGQSYQNSYWPPLLGTNDPNTTTALVFLGASFVIITVIPKTVELIKAMIERGQFNYGAALNEATNPLGLRSLAMGIGKEVVTKTGTTWGLYGLRNIMPPSQETRNVEGEPPSG